MVRNDNQNALALYLECGFKGEARMEKYIRIDGLFYPGLAMARFRGGPDRQGLTRAS